MMELLERGGVLFKPNYYFPRVTKVSLSFLKQQQIDTLILDVDNTLTVDKGTRFIPGAEQWLAQMRRGGIRLIILSNASPKRMAALAQKMQLPFVGLGLKPLPFGYFRAVKRAGGSLRRAAIIGDQLFTDILGGKLAFCKTILVAPAKLETTRGFKIKRAMERRLLKHYRLPNNF